MVIIWDEAKRLANLDKHGVDFADFNDAFSFDHFATAPAKAAPSGRARIIFIGAWRDGRVVSAIVAPLGTEALSLISLRRAGKKEREAYERT